MTEREGRVEERERREPATRDYLLKLILAFVITGFGGLMLEKEGSAKFRAHCRCGTSAWLDRPSCPCRPSS